MYALWNNAFLIKFPLHEIVVIEILIRQAESVGVGCFRPAGVFIRTAFWTRLGAGRDVCAAVGAGFGRHEGKYSVFSVQYSVFSIQKSSIVARVRVAELNTEN